MFQKDREIAQGGRRRRSKGSIGDWIHPIVTGADVHALFLILNIGPTQRLPIDPDPQVAVRHRRSRGRAMVLLEGCRAEDPGDAVATAKPYGANRRWLSNGSADIVLTDFFSETGSRRTN